MYKLALHFELLKVLKTIRVQNEYIDNFTGFLFSQFRSCFQLLLRKLQRKSKNLSNKVLIRYNYIDIIYIYIYIYLCMYIYEYMIVKSILDITSYKLLTGRNAHKDSCTRKSVH